MADPYNPLDDLSPVDRIRLRMELSNRARVSEEEAARNRRVTVEEALSMIPGPGNVIAARDAYRGGSEAVEDFRQGRLKRGAMNAGMAGLSAFGAVTGLPFGRVARDVARDAGRTMRSGVGPTAKPIDPDALARARFAANNAKMDIGSLDQLRQLLRSSEDEKFFVRWSRGPDYDMKPGAVSKDYQTGQLHAGLSAEPIDAGMDDQGLIRFLREYSYLNANNNPAKPHIYAGKVVGRDSDGADSIRPTRYVGTMSDDIISKLYDDAYFERARLSDAISMYKRILNGTRDGAPLFYNKIEGELDLAQRKLADLGGE